MNLDQYHQRRDEWFEKIERLPLNARVEPARYVYRYYNDDARVGHRLHCKTIEQRCHEAMQKVGEALDRL